MTEKTTRSLIKAVTWRVTASLITFMLAFFFSQDFNVSLSIGLGDFVIKYIAYFLHEVGWSKIKWGYISNEKKD